MMRKKRRPTAYSDVLTAIGTNTHYQTVPQLVARTGRARSTVIAQLVTMQRAGLVVTDMVDDKPGYRLAFPELFHLLEY